MGSAPESQEPGEDDTPASIASRHGPTGKTIADLTVAKICVATFVTFRPWQTLSSLSQLSPLSY